jgi:anti-sigma regulatory factor (Ser/Thr protein kinase)
MEKSSKDPKMDRSSFSKSHPSSLALTKTFNADLSELYSILEFIRSHCFELPDEVIRKIVLTAEEVAVNIIRHSYPQTTGLLDITCELSLNLETAAPIKNDHGSKNGVNLSSSTAISRLKDSFFRITFKDKGIAFNPLEKQIVSFKKGGGLGIQLYKEIMDDIQYLRLDNQNILTLTKYLSSMI